MDVNNICLRELEMFIDDMALFCSVHNVQDDNLPFYFYVLYRHECDDSDECECEVHRAFTGTKAKAIDDIAQCGACVVCCACAA
jgi:hypothetical protein